MARIYLGGGGDDNDEAALWKEAFTPGQRVSIWPFAVAAGPARTAATQWLSSALHARGDFTIDAWGIGEENYDIERLQESQVLAIPGGNTFDLLHHLQQFDLLCAMERFLDEGGEVYGGSAGAILLGADIAIAASEDANSVGIEDTQGLNRLAGAVVRPHYQPLLDAELRQWAREQHHIVLGVPERSGLVVTDGTARNVGPETVQVFTPEGESQHYLSGDVIDLVNLQQP